MSNYAIVNNNKIMGHYSGPIPASPLPDGSIVVQVPDPWDTSGQDIREYDGKLNLLPLAQRVAAGLVTVPLGQKVVGENMEPMTEAERVKAGLDPRPSGQVLDVDAQGNVILRPASIPEQVANGDMTQATADTINAVNVRAERDARLAGCDWVDTVSAQTRVPSATLAQWMTYRQALRDITKQAGFPSGALAWPTSPDGVTP